MSQTLQYATVGFIAWSFLGICGARAIYCMWFSGPLRKLRREPPPWDIYALGVFLGPLNLLIAAMFFAFGLHRSGATNDHD